MEAVLDSPSRVPARKSEKLYTKNEQRRDRGREMLKPAASGFKEGCPLQEAALSATNFEMALWKPAAVREKDRERTGLKSW
jgi:hypothetical protein